MINLYCDNSSRSCSNVDEKDEEEAGFVIKSTSLEGICDRYLNGKLNIRQLLHCSASYSF